MKRTNVALGVLFVFLMVLPIVANAAVSVAQSELSFDGEKLHGLKGFTYKVYKDRQDVHGIGINYGRLHVRGKILVHSNSELLNTHMDDYTSFEIILSIMQESYPEGLSTRSFAFKNCTLHAIHSLWNPAGERDFRVYSFTAEGVAGVFLTEDVKITIGDVQTSWEFDDDGESLNTVTVVTDGAEIINAKVDYSTFHEAMAYQLDSHGYALDTYTLTADRIREA